MSMNPRKGTVTSATNAHDYCLDPPSDEHESSEGDCDPVIKSGLKIGTVGQMSMNPRKGTVTKSVASIVIQSNGMSDEHESSEGDCDVA